MLFELEFRFKTFFILDNFNNKTHLKYNLKYNFAGINFEGIIKFNTCKIYIIKLLFKQNGNLPLAIRVCAFTVFTVHT